jgi:glycosyltransferase involved in cell wall biosynthesis
VNGHERVTGFVPAPMSSPSDPTPKRSLRIAIVGSRGIPARYGGVETFAEEIAQRLSAQGVEVTVFCEATKGGRPMRLGRIRLEYVRAPGRGPLARILYEVGSLMRSRKGYDVVYMLGYSSSFACWIPRLFGRRVWINMDGLEWRRSRWGPLARRWLKFMEGIACKAAHRLIFDNQALAAEVQGRRNPSAAISVLAYGAPLVVKAPSLEPVNQLGLEAQRYILMVCRFEPENHVLEIVRAAAARSGGPPLIVIANTSDNNAWQREVMAHAGPLVQFLGPIYDPATLRSLRFHCQLYVHGHSVGGTNPSLLEAMGCGNFILAHSNSFNREVLGAMGGYFDSEVDLGLKLQAAEHVSERQRRMVGDGARDRVMNYYTWEQVTAGYLELLQFEMNRTPKSTESPIHKAAI